MSKQLNLDELNKMRAELSNTIKVVTEEAGKARDAGEIDDSQWLEAKDEWGKLETQESELQGEINNLELGFLLNTNVDSPRSRILQATKSLKTAAQRIDNFQSFLSKIGEVVDIFASTIKAIQTGGLLTL